MTLLKIISGGQTGVDRAALDVALELGIACGGWCPKGRRAEDGVIPAKYPVRENGSPAYPARTAMNVRDSDGTLILSHGQPDRGTALTAKLAEKYKKPFLVIDFEDKPSDDDKTTWTVGHGIVSQILVFHKASEKDQQVQHFERILMEYEIRRLSLLQRVWHASVHHSLSYPGVGGRPGTGAKHPVFSLSRLV